MMNAKYIIIDGSAVVFSPAIAHNEMAGMRNVTSAGFVDFFHKENEYGEIEIKAKCYGSSYSLGIESKPEDGEIITMQLFRTF